jgi:hypothetical protein
MLQQHCQTWKDRGNLAIWMTVFVIWKSQIAGTNYYCLGNAVNFFFIIMCHWPISVTWTHHVSLSMSRFFLTAKAVFTRNFSCKFKHLARPNDFSTYNLKSSFCKVHSTAGNSKSDPHKFQHH